MFSSEIRYDILTNTKIDSDRFYPSEENIELLRNHMYDSEHIRATLYGHAVGAITNKAYNIFTIPVTEVLYTSSYQNYVYEQLSNLSGEAPEEIKGICRSLKHLRGAPPVPKPVESHSDKVLCTRIRKALKNGGRTLHNIKSHMNNNVWREIRNDVFAFCSTKEPHGLHDLRCWLFMEKKWDNSTVFNRFVPAMNEDRILLSNALNTYRKEFEFTLDDLQFLNEDVSKKAIEHLTPTESENGFNKGLDFINPYYTAMALAEENTAKQEEFIRKASQLNRCEQIRVDLGITVQDLWCLREYVTQVKVDEGIEALEDSNIERHHKCYILAGLLGHLGGYFFKPYVQERLIKECDRILGCSG